MEVLLLGVGALLATLSLVFVWTGRASAVAARSAILDWYKNRKQEINVEPAVSNEDTQCLLEELDARVLEDIDSEANSGTDTDREADNFASGSAGSLRAASWWLRPLLVAVIFSGGLLLYWYLGAAKDVVILDQLVKIDQNSSAESVAETVALIEARLEHRPDNGHYWALLARHYIDRGLYQQAMTANDELLRLLPDDPAALAQSAQSEYLFNDRRLTDRAQQRARRALSLDPGQTTAQGLLGIAAFEQGQFAAAIEYWTPLLDSSSAGSSSRGVIEQGIARARMQLAAQVGEHDEVEQQPSPAVSINVSLAEGAVAQASDTVFVLARLPGQRMPLAVKKYRVGDLPIQLLMDDGDSMLGNQSLSTAIELEIVATVSPSGQPGQKYATLEAIVGPVKAAVEAPKVTLQLTAPAAR